MGKHAGKAALDAAIVAAAVLLAGQAGADGTAGRPLRLALSGAEEFDAAGNPINPHGDADRGEVTLTLNRGQERICWTFGPITLTAGEALPHVAHIHQAPACRAGPVVVNLFGTPDTPAAPSAYPTETTCVHADGDLVRDILRDRDGYYVNLHNAQHPGGVMRAQLG